MPVLRPLLVAAGVLAASGAIAQAPPAEPSFTVTDFVVEGENPLDVQRTDALLAPFVGEHVGLAGLQAAADALEAELRKAGFAFHRVTLPPQESTGVIRLRVLAFKLGKVEVSGNEHFSDDNLRRSLPALRPGESPNGRELARDLALAREHPAKQIELVMKESDQPDSIDASIRVSDLAPRQFFAGLANTGSSETGDWRASLGVQHSNLFDLDHAITLSYTSSPGRWSDVSQVGVFYRIPFYGYGAGLGLFASYSDVDSGTIADFFDVTGRGTFFGAQFRQHLWPVGPYSHSVDIGVQDRFFDNSKVLFSGVPLTPNVRSRPLALRYEGKQDAVGSTVAFHLEYAANLPGGAANSDENYAANSAGGDRSWSAWRFGAEAAHALGDWQIEARLRGQHAGEPLISGEQFGTGGAASLRGLEERELRGDRGIQANLELTSPPVVESLRVAGFFDAGRTYQINVVPSTAWAASAGIGLRARWRESLLATLDAAYVLRAVDAPETRDGDTKLHFSMLYRF